jgi:hypothetical protein
MTKCLVKTVFQTWFVEAKNPNLDILKRIESNKENCWMQNEERNIFTGTSVRFKTTEI